jgi:hypothetical protein
MEKEKHNAQYWAAIGPMALHCWLSPEGKAASQPMPPVARHIVTFVSYNIYPHNLHTFKLHLLNQLNHAT